MRWFLLGLVSCAIGACGSVADEPLEHIEYPRERGDVPPTASGASAPTRGGTGSATDVSPTGVTPGDALPGETITALDASSSGDAADAAGASDAGASDAAASYLTDALAPLPPAQDGGGFNAIYVPSVRRIYLPLFSMPSCQVIPPYGEAYVVSFELAPNGPSAVLPSCYTAPGETSPAETPCYTPARMIALDLSGYMLGSQNFAGGRYELSPFDAEGIATGFVSTQQGVVPLAVKRCP